MEITFLYHSAFLVELETCSLLFDWHGGRIPDIDRSKPLYVFASHHHGDHYAPEIFSLLGMEGTWYVLGSCIRLSARRREALRIQDDHVFRLGAGRRLTLGPLTVETIHSTDAGVAFLVQVEGRTIFHAGDLQWWQWAEESAEWNREMERDFKRTIEPLRGRRVDAAFLVLDPRQEDDYWKGFDAFLRTMDIGAAFPMHSWEEFWVVKKLKRDPCSAPYRDRVREIYYDGQTFTV